MEKTCKARDAGDRSILTDLIRLSKMPPVACEGTTINPTAALPNASDPLTAYD